jgi:hypothetical protein
MLEVVTKLVMGSGKEFYYWGGFQYMKYVQMDQAG